MYDFLEVTETVVSPSKPSTTLKLITAIAPVEAILVSLSFAFTVTATYPSLFTTDTYTFLSAESVLSTV